MENPLQSWKRNRLEEGTKVQVQVTGWQAGVVCEQIGQLLTNLESTARMTQCSDNFMMWPGKSII